MEVNSLYQIVIYLLCGKLFMKNSTDKNNFFSLLHKAISPKKKAEHEKGEHPKHEDYSGKQTHQDKPVNT